ncbi:MAG: hypothetical protein LBM27_02210 [Lactobacillaceae bacterium]|jgi:hypothetical protein|nr:hypothetical protein [Lactobacillaceae bacterium]
MSEIINWLKDGLLQDFALFAVFYFPMDFLKKKLTVRYLEEKPTLGDGDFGYLYGDYSDDFKTLQMVRSIPSWFDLIKWIFLKFFIGGRK